MRYTILCFLLFASLSCKKTDAQISLDPNKPEKKFTLPVVLNEVSGMTVLDSLHLALVQDEKGIIFIFHIPTGEIVNQFSFDSIGDYEGLAFAEQSLFILRSDGRLTEWKDFRRDTGGGEITHTSLPLHTKDNEGLSYDKQNKRLLIAAKNKPNAPGNKSERYIYSYDLATREVVIDQKYSLNTERLGVKAKEFGAGAGLFNSKGKPKTFNFRPSSLEIHPKTGELYIISATDQLMVILDKNGQIKNIQPLPAKVFSKPEGITFLEDGTMFISNEADGKEATILIWDF